MVLAPVTAAISWSLPEALSEPHQVTTHCGWKQELQLGSLGQDPNALGAMLPLETPSDGSILASFYLRWLATLVQDGIITEQFKASIYKSVWVPVSTQPSL